MKPLCDGAGEGALGSRAIRKGVRSVGRGGGVGGIGVAVREGAGVVSNVRESHSLVTACRSIFLNEG